MANIIREIGKKLASSSPPVPEYSEFRDDIYRLIISESFIKSSLSAHTRESDRLPIFTCPIDGPHEPCENTTIQTAACWVGFTFNEAGRIRAAMSRNHGRIGLNISTKSIPESVLGAVIDYNINHGYLSKDVIINSCKSHVNVTLPIQEDNLLIRYSSMCLLRDIYSNIKSLALSIRLHELLKEYGTSYLQCYIYVYHTLLKRYSIYSHCFFTTSLSPGSRRYPMWFMEDGRYVRTISLKSLALLYYVRHLRDFQINKSNSFSSQRHQFLHNIPYIRDTFISPIDILDPRIGKIMKSFISLNENGHTVFNADLDTFEEVEDVLLHYNKISPPTSLDNSYKDLYDL